MPAIIDRWDHHRGACWSILSSYGDCEGFAQAWRLKQWLSRVVTGESVT